MSPMIWGSDAEQFLPDRWNTLNDVPNTQFLTFQYGLHSCVSANVRSPRMYWAEICRDGDESFACCVGRFIRVSQSSRTTGGEVQSNYHETEEWAIFKDSRGTIVISLARKCDFSSIS